LAQGLIAFKPFRTRQKVADYSGKIGNLSANLVVSWPARTKPLRSPLKVSHSVRRAITLTRHRCAEPVAVVGAKVRVFWSDGAYNVIISFVPQQDPLAGERGTPIRVDYDDGDQNHRDCRLVGGPFGASLHYGLAGLPGSSIVQAAVQRKVVFAVLVPEDEAESTERLASLSTCRSRT
jgi:hypothetical protein